MLGKFRPKAKANPTHSGGKSLLTRKLPLNKRNGLIFIAIFAVVGASLLVITRAATSPVAFEPETGALAAGATSVANANASGGRVLAFAGAATPAPTPPPVAGVYGAGVGIDGKANVPIGEYTMAIKFKASTSSALQGVRFTQRFGPVYSGGNGGTMTVQLRPDNGAGQPHASTVLATMSFSPGNYASHTEIYDLKTFPSPPNLTAGTIYYVVFSNGSDTSNYISVNNAYNEAPTTPRQPRFPDSDFAVMQTAGGSWSFRTVSSYTPVVDLVYANGAIDGQCYYESMNEQYANISGTGGRIRENMLVSGGNKTVKGVYARVRRTSGTSPLILTLKDSAGNAVNSVSVPSTSVPVSSPGSAASGAVWVGGTFSTPATLSSGSRYSLELSTASGTTYSTWPIRARGNPQQYNSFRFSDGVFEYATTGTNWTRGYYDPYQVNMQMYFTLN